VPNADCPFVSQTSKLMKEQADADFGSSTKMSLPKLDLSYARRSEIFPFPRRFLDSTRRQPEPWAYRRRTLH